MTSFLKSIWAWMQGYSWGEVEAEPEEVLHGWSIDEIEQKVGQEDFDEYE